MSKVTDEKSSNLQLYNLITCNIQPSAINRLGQRSQISMPEQKLRKHCYKRGLRPRQKPLLISIVCSHPDFSPLQLVYIGEYRFKRLFVHSPIKTSARRIR